MMYSKDQMVRYRWVTFFNQALGLIMTNTLFELNVHSTHYNTANTVSLMLLTGSIMGLSHNGSPFLGHTKSFF